MVENIIISRKFIFRNFFLLLGFFLILGNFSAQAMDPPPVQASEQLEEATRKLENLPIRTTSGAIPLHNQGFKGRNIKIAVVDSGFSEALKDQRTEEPSLIHKQWDDLNAQKLESLKSYISPEVVAAREASTVEHLSKHGRSMVSHIRTVATEAFIAPHEIDEKAESWIRALTVLADDPSIHIINASWPLPGYEKNPSYLDPLCKQAILNCLEKGKVFVLSACNTGDNIPEKPQDLQGTKTKNDFWTSYYNSHNKLGDLFQDYDKNSKAFANLLVIGSTNSDDSSVLKDSVKPGNGVAQNHYIHVNANHARTFFDEEDCPKGWGGTSSSAAAASGLIACLWEGTGLQTPGSEILKAILESGEKDMMDPGYEGRGKFDPINTYNYLELKKVWNSPCHFKNKEENLYSKMILTDNISKLKLLKKLITNFNVWNSDNLNDILNEIAQPSDDSKPHEKYSKKKKKLFNFFLKNIIDDVSWNDGIISKKFESEVIQTIHQGKELNKLFCEFITKINYSYLKNFQKIDLPKNFSGLKKISFNNSNLTELTGLENTPNLEELWAQNTPLTKISFPALLRLKLIDLMGSKLSILEGLENLLNLEFLNLERTSHLQILEFLSPQEKLKTLNLRCSNVQVMMGFEKLISLEIFNSENSKIESLTFHNSLKNIKKLYLEDLNGHLKSITGLGTLQNLEELELKCLYLETLKFENSLQQLKILKLNKIEFEEEALDFEEIRGFYKFPNLEELRITDTGLASVDFTEPLEKLRIVDLTGSSVSSITGLEKIPNLGELTLWKARNIKTLKFEKDSKNLKLVLRFSGVKTKDQIEGFDEYLDEKNVRF